MSEQVVGCGNLRAVHFRRLDGSGVLFYIKMQLLEGELEPSPPAGAKWYDFAWVGVEELPQFLTHDQAQAQLLQALM